MSGELEPVGEWEKIVRPMADDLELPGKMGVGIHLGATSAARYGRVIVTLARVADIYAAREHADKCWRRFEWGLIVFVLLLIAMARAA